MRRVMSEFYDVGNPKASLSAYEYDRIRRFAGDFLVNMPVMLRSICLLIVDDDNYL
jgi:hypothetical protein